MPVKVHLIDVTGFVLRDGTSGGDWFKRAFRNTGLSENTELIVYDGISGKLPRPQVAAGSNNCLMVSGSYGPVFDEKPWIPPLIRLLRSTHELNGWILGICFGHHALARALGGEVENNPRGREMGSVPVFLTAEGMANPLFEGFGSGDFMNIVHKTHVSSLPRGAVRLAFNRMTPTQSFYKDRAFGLQPHPEMTPSELGLLAEKYKYLLIRKEKFLQDEDHYNNFIDSFRETPSSMTILVNFIKMVRENKG